MTFESTNPIPGEDDDQPVPHQQQRGGGHLERLRAVVDAWRAERMGDVMVFVERYGSGQRFALRETDLRAALEELERQTPNEQQPAEATGGEQAQDGAAGRVEAFLDRRAELQKQGGISGRIGAEVIARVQTSVPWELTDVDLRAVLAERDALAARVESATVLPERWRALIAERDAAVRRLAELHDEWGVQSADSGRAQVCDDEDHAWRLADRYSRFRLPGGERVQHRVVRRLAGDWSDALAPDAAPDGQSATLRAEDGVQASGSELEFERRSAGLSEARFDYGISPFCNAPNPNSPLRCGRLRDHEPPHRRGERTWTDDTTEDDR